MRVLVASLVSVFAMAFAAPAAQAVEEFSVDPLWTAVGNKTVKHSDRANDFGPRLGPTQPFGAQNSVLGGIFTRSPTYANYAYVPPTASTLESSPFPPASGVLAVGNTITGGSGVWLGWHGSTSRGERANNTFGVRLDQAAAIQGECGAATLGARVVLALTTSRWTANAAIYKRPDPKDPKRELVLCPGTAYRWFLEYSPTRSASWPQGYAEFRIDGVGQPVRIALTAENRTSGASFNRFGLWAAMTTSPEATRMEAYIDDLRVNNTYLGFDAGTDLSRWVANNTGPTPFPDEETPKTDVVVPGGLGSGGTGPCLVTNALAQDFGYSPGTSVAGGAHPGEMGGLITRRDSALPNASCDASRPRSPGEFSYGKKTTTSLSLDRELVAQGKLNVRASDTDASTIVGWYLAGSVGTAEGTPPSTLGFTIDNIADYGLIAAPTVKAMLQQGVEPARLVPEPRTNPIIARDRVYDFHLHYVPAPVRTNGGTLTLTLNDGFTFPKPEISLNIPGMTRTQGARFTHFGLRGYDQSGGPMRIFLDDLSFTE